ncbi:hypothetical protein Caci_1185 [Catenulispora acidiphila DSM 44928]|uniref:DUF7824 domain-containing protein n=1 Tax=Catenulispora acidiphila (strain DSM 44928 / JCM 14897 / NBRC 102108 / NRRL B-24433 / ID139908) TaxID=479433 RepID=C7Q613_CATAD|nr:DUF6493 family protein [Catenulispora acidiphila]ACU70110.1 hypothetical protein Caci_1185 [Catenulispora acidiphila DSM 44928]
MNTQGAVTIGAATAAGLTPQSSPEDFTFTLRLTGGDAKSVADFFQGMAEKERRTYIKPLREFLRSIGWRTMNQDENWRDFHQRRSLAMRTLTPTALAVFSTASATAKFLRSAQRSDSFDPSQTAAIRQILADRAPAWLPDLPAALLETLEPEDLYRLVEVVGDVAQIPLPATREFVRVWGVKYRWTTDEDRTRDQILADPRLAELAPLVFDDDENDDLFPAWSVFRRTVLSAVKEGKVPRAEVLDASLRRLLRGGRPGALQDHLAFWTALEPVDGEIVERVSSCISLLSSQSGTVARTFLAALKKASDAGLLDLEPALEAASIAVTRPEKNVVKTTLGWLDSLAAGNPARAGQMVGAIATAFSGQAADLQERAVKLVGKHAKALGEDERERLAAEARIHLAPDLAARLAGLLKVSQDSPIDDAGLGYPDVAPYVPRPLLPPIGSPAELAEVFGALMHADPVEAMVFERMLEAVVVFERTDPAALREALAPVVERWWPGWDWTKDQSAVTPRTAMCVLVAAAAGMGGDARRHPHRAGVKQLWSRARARGWGIGWWRRTRTTPADFLIMRAAEVHAALGMPDLPPLVSVPTSPTGAIEPAVLAARLRQCQAQGCEPLEADFHQALLRLPEDCGDVDVSGLTSKAGVRFAAWVAGERIVLPQPRIPDAEEREEERSRGHADSRRRAMRGEDVVPETLLDLAPGVWREPDHCRDQSDWMACWPAIVPSRPDLAALAMIGGVGWSTAPPSPESAVVLAEQDGPQGGTHQVIAARLASDDVQLRASGVDAALVLAARGLLEPAMLSAALTSELRASASGLRRLVPALRDVANGGAARAVWETVALMLPRVVPPAVPKTLSGTTELLVLATELAGTLGVRTPIATVGALAEKKGGSAVTNAARRLEAVLRAG